MMLEASICEVETMDRWGSSPLSEARRCKHPEVEAYLSSIMDNPGAGGGGGGGGERWGMV